MDNNPLTPAKAMEHRAYHSTANLSAQRLPHPRELRLVFGRLHALTTLLRLRLITLHDYLDALGEEYEAYTFNPLRARLSLIAASPDKFANPASYELVYRKGMLVAALYDLELRWQSGGRQSLMDVMRALYQTYAPSRSLCPIWRNDLATGHRAREGHCRWPFCHPPSASCRLRRHDHRPGQPISYSFSGS